MLEKSKKKGLVLSGLLFLALAWGLIGGTPSTSHQGSTVNIAYADGCDGPNPPPDLDCRPTPTPTPFGH